MNHQTGTRSGTYANNSPNSPATSTTTSPSSPKTSAAPTATPRSPPFSAKPAAPARPSTGPDAASPTASYDQQLLDLLVQILHQQGDHDAVLEERRADFDRRPIASTYHALITAGAKANQTATVQPQALDLLRHRTATEPRRAAELIKVLLDLGHTDEAWTTANQHPEVISETLWHDLLNRRQVTHPADVLPHYRRLTEAHIADSRDKQRYRRAVTLLLRMREATAAAHQHDEFGTYTAELRRTNRIRPNFLTELDKAHP
ncbi:MAG: hypothetical protein QOE61_1507 [Micromonosporaceae bacterium]|nr:hypothetical protein [Micromonosporaceae bacterium]